MVKIDITPDKTLFPKLGSSGYSVPQALAELIDNSIDARVDNGMEISINLYSDKITIADRGIGMNFEEIKNAVILARSSKEGKLGEFGLGLKTSCLSLGKSFKVISKKLGEDKEYKVIFETEKWLKDDSWEIDVTDREMESDKHYTVIEITDLKSKTIATADKRLKEDIQVRFGHYLDEITIKVNGDRVFKKVPELSEGTRKEIEIDTTYGNITGWVGLMKDSSQKGFYGLQTYRNNRLIIPFNKIGFSAHPTVARIYGELHLDFVPVTHNKKSFEKESDQYKSVETLMELELKDIVAEARKKKGEELLTGQVKDQTETWEAKTSEAIKQVVSKLPEEKINKKLPENNVQSRIIHEDEDKEIHINEIQFEKYSTEKRSDNKILHIDFAGQNLSFTHIFDSIGSEKGPKLWNYDSGKKIITIITNTDFSTYYACKDLPFLALINISESLTEFLLNGKDNENSLTDYKRIFNMIIRIASDLKEELD
ncbi:MAG: ATP-binding protein [Candidatus Gracilibacteria bacterium]|nr:ATP-binding protein [Candidatus Gracilibacteria bacterium]